MARKAFLTGMSGLLLVCIMVLAGCPDPTSGRPDPNPGQPDTWTEVTDVNVLAGTWKGTGTIQISAQTISMDEEGGGILQLPASSMGIDMTFTYVAGEPNAGIAITVDMENILEAAAEAISSDAELKGYLAIGVILSSTFDGALSDADKTLLLADFGLSPVEMGALMGGGSAAAAALAKLRITKNHVWYIQGGDLTKKYTITPDQDPIPAGDLLAEEVFVNQDGTKIKLMVPQAAFEETTMTVGAVDLILNKQ
jgi:multidrug efflux pump subunit AcrA (membrane-fusion protein)